MKTKTIFISLILFGQFTLISAFGVFLLPNKAISLDLTPENIVNLTNRERELTGLPSLYPNPLLESAALAKAEAVFRTGLFQHTLGDRKFSTWIKEAGYDYSYVGENLAIDFITSEGAMSAWKNSPSHYRNITNEYFKEIGVAVKDGIFNGQPTRLIVQIFGAPSLVATAADGLPVSRPLTSTVLSDASGRSLSRSNNEAVADPASLTGLSTPDILAESAPSVSTELISQTLSLPYLNLNGYLDVVQPLKNNLIVQLNNLLNLTAFSILMITIYLCLYFVFILPLLGWNLFTRSEK